MNITINRKYLKKQVEGVLYINDQEFRTLERAWKENERNVSCIPEGKYKITKEVHSKFGRILRVHNVPNRLGILMHVGNYYSHSKGCILPGMKLIYDINKDGLKDVTNSKKAMDLIFETLPFNEENYLIIKS